MQITEENGVVSTLLNQVPIPRVFKVKQTFPRPYISIDDIPKHVANELDKEGISSLVKPGMKIAITVGSRGIKNVDIITKSIVDYVKNKSAFPFIVPAMGSHGGATAEGQKEILKGYGITEERMGAEIHSSMETTYLGESDSGKPVFLDKFAMESDGIIVSCRLKPHNAFRGKYESGPCKMMAIGLGKQKGAEHCHSDGMGKIHKHIPSIASVILTKAPILFALADIENAYDETCHLEAIPAAEIMEREKELLTFASRNMPKILVGEADVLVVDEIGKNYSGTGVDPNITGTFSTPFATGGLVVQRTCFLDLSDSSHGNGLGIGLADCITKKLFNKIDMNAMYPNCITSTVLASARIPIVVNNDKEAIQLCIRTTNGIDMDPQKLRLVRIPNSLHLESILLSEFYFSDVQNGKYPGVEITSDLFELRFTEGNIFPFE